MDTNNKSVSKEKIKILEPEIKTYKRVINKPPPCCFIPDLSNKKTVGINGFGRIGKLIYSICIKRGIPVVQINDPNTSVDDIVYSLTYDNCYGKLLNVLKCKIDNNYINGKYKSCNCDLNINNINCNKNECKNSNCNNEHQEKNNNNKNEKCEHSNCNNEHKEKNCCNKNGCKNSNCNNEHQEKNCCKKYTETHIIFRTLITKEKEPSKIGWKCDILIEASGLFKTNDLIDKHGIKKVIVTAPSNDIPMFIFGVNHENYLNDMPNYISNASCTTNCLAPIVQVLDKEFEIIKGTMSTIHSVTSSQSVVDRSSKLRRNRSILNNIIPTTTGATNAVIKIFPHLEDRLTGMAFRVPTLDVSCVDLTVFLKKECTKETLINLIKKGNRNILDYIEDEVVSSDFIGDSRSCILDVSASIINGRWIKLICWYDNEYGYAQRTVDMLSFVLKHSEKKEEEK